MDKVDFYEQLDIDEATDFQYFENLALLFESDDDIDFELIAELIPKVDKDVLAGLVDDYFNEILEFVPGSETEIYTVLDNIRRSLIGMARNPEDETVVTKLAEEIDRFRKWYSLDSVVYCTKVGEMTEKVNTVRDALVLSRLEKLGEEKYEYSFSEALDYPIDEYVMSFADMISLSEEDSDGDTDDSIYSDDELIKDEMDRFVSDFEVDEI